MNIPMLVDKQRQFFMNGGTLDTVFRLDALRQLSGAIKEMESEIIHALRDDLNKSELEAYMTEISLIQGEIAFARKNLTKWAKKQKTRSTIAFFPAKCYRVPEPYGIVLIMSPWNYPFLLAIEPLVGALAAGNCAIIKPSEYAPATAAIVHKLISKCFPEEYCAVVQGSVEESDKLLKQKFDYILFTGSVAVGRIVMESASKYLTPVTLELGGKSPVIVDESAKIDLSAKRLVFSKFINAGQTCVAPDYVLVHESKKDELIKALKRYINLCYPKDAQGNVIDYPRIINEKNFQRICDLMKGEKIATGGKVNPRMLTIEPTLLNDVSFDAPIMQEEIFGPVLPIISYKNFGEVIAEICRRPKPLALYLFSEDKEKWAIVEKNVPFGGGCINDCMLQVSSPHLPFGGVGDSGMGQYHGKSSFDTFTHYKSIVNKSTKLDLDIRYRPYTEKKERMIRKLL